MSRFEPREIEPKWQAAWEKAGTFTARRDESRPKYYVLEMFPYPSGRIHMGHVRNYTMGDVVARYKASCGFSVLHPMGWDAFGMPAENAAMERGGHPKDWTYGNIADMRGQMKPLGLSIDWSREFATCDPEYYGQQQAMFIDMLNAGLVYRKSAVVNWDPVDMTVLANEQVVDGRGWRSGAEVERRELTQWFFKISDFSEELLEALDGLDDWPEKVKLMQRNWIGKSRGLQMAFSLIDGPEGHDRIEVYTTRPDTLMGASFVGISPDHPLARHLEAQDDKVAEFCAEARRGGTTEEAIETAEKLGYDTGLRVRHPFDTAWELPVYIANFILMDYGTGAIFGCPAHDQRDLDFARKYDLPVIDTFVALEDGKQGWVLSRFLTTVAPTGEKLKALQEAHDALTAELAALKREREALSEENQRLELLSGESRRALEEMAHSYDTLKTESKDFLKVKSDYETASRRFEEEKAAAEALQARMENLEWRKNAAFFIGGGALVLLGFLIGASSRGGSRRRSPFI
mgnify:CR=1 FL=1